MKKTEKVSNKLKLGTKLAYGTGDFYGGASAAVISMLFLFFLTDVVGMRAMYAGIVVFIGRAVDAITDPFMGNISDHTRSKWGRRNPYFLFFAIPVGLAFGMLFVKIPFQEDGVLLAYYTFAYVLFSITFTAVMVPYAALAPELTGDYHERTSLISTRMAFSIIGALFAAVVPKTIIDLAEKAEVGYMTMAIILGIIFIIIWFNMFIQMKGKEKYTERTKKEPFFRALFSTFKNRAFLALIGIYLFAFIVNDIMSANFIYFLTYYMKRSNLYTVVMGSLLVSAILSLLIYIRLSKKVGKRKTFIIGASYWLVVLLGLLLLKPDTSSVIVVVYAVLLGIGTGTAYAIPWSMLPDVVDLDVIVSGKRREGLYSGVMTFLRKLSSSVAILGISFVLELSGYVVSDQVNVTQPASAVAAIRYIITLAPTICLVIAILCAIWFPIKNNNYKAIKQWLDIKSGKMDANAQEKLSIAKQVESIIGSSVEKL